MTKQTKNSEYQWEVFATLLKETAEKKEISNYKIANETGYSASTIKRVFDLDFCPKFQIILDIASVLNVKVNFKPKK